jgi:hypothetical protein
LEREKTDKLLVRGEKITVVFIHQFECPAAAPGHTGQRVIRHEYRQTGFL